MCSALRRLRASDTYIAAPRPRSDKEAKVSKEHKRRARDPGGQPPALADEVLRRVIELRAYHRFCECGCAPGHDLDDWLAAEKEVLAEMLHGATLAVSRQTRN